MVNAELSGKRSDKASLEELLFLNMDKLGEKGLQLFQSRAAEYIKDKGKLSGILNLALRKGMSSDKFKDAWEKLQLFISVVRDWMNGEYREISKRTIISVVAALIYFITPADLIPDFIPFTGLLDDAAVLSFVFRQVSQDLEKYKLWKENRITAQGEESEPLNLTEEIEDSSQSTPTELRTASSEDADGES